MKISMVILGLMTVSTSAFASNSNQFCAPQAAAAAQSLANTNGSVSDTVESSTSRNGRTYTVVLSEQGLGSDSYSITTSAEHDCVIYSVKVNGQPTLRP